MPSTKRVERFTVSNPADRSSSMTTESKEALTVLKGLHDSKLEQSLHSKLETRLMQIKESLKEKCFCKKEGILVCNFG